MKCKEIRQDPGECRYLEMNFRSQAINSGFAFMTGANSTVRMSIMFLDQALKSSSGDIIKFSTMGQAEIVIASAQVAFDLLESRGNKI